MAPYMKPKDFARFYWPTFRRTVEGIQQGGFKASAYAEEDWTPHLEALNDLPGRCCLAFEKPTPEDIVAKVSTKHIFSTIYPTSLFRTGTKQECIDKARCV